ncbi:arginase [Cohnella lubricantis]|nr:arginase [Cohnella lubricantis]MBP2119093.1 arginase [Cohnella lubricantis]
MAHHRRSTTGGTPAQTINLIRVPFWLGCGRRGTELGPDSIVEAGLIAQLEALGVEIAVDLEVDCRGLGAEAYDGGASLRAEDSGCPILGARADGDCQVRGAEADGGFPARGDGADGAGLKRNDGKIGAAEAEIQFELEEKDGVGNTLYDDHLRDGDGKVKHLTETKEMSRRVAASVYRAAAACRFSLVLGGDHSAAIGSLAGLTAHYERLGVIWIDAHADINTEETTPSGHMHGMPLAVALGKARFKLTELPGAKLLRPDKLVIVGARDLDPGERELIRAEGIACFTMHDIDRLGMAAVIAKALDIAGRDTDGMHVSFDMDSLDPSEAGGVGTPVRGGLSYREAHLAMELLAESGRVTSLDLVEVNALLDHDRRTAKLAVELASSLFGKRIL